MTVPDCLAVYLPGTDPAPVRRPCGCRGTGRGQHQRACRKRKLPRCSLCTAAGLLPHQYAWLHRGQLEAVIDALEARPW